MQRFHTFLVLAILLQGMTCFAQEKLNEHHVGLNLGINYNLVTGNSFAEPTIPIGPNTGWTINGFDRVSTTSFQFGLLYAFRSRHQAYVQAGFNVFDTKEKWVADKAFVESYYTPYFEDPVYIRIESEYQLEVPFAIGYVVSKKFDFNVGAKMRFAEFRRDRETSITDKNYSSKSYWSNGFIKSLTQRHNYTPSVTFQYHFVVEDKYRITSFVAFEDREFGDDNDYNRYDLQLGVRFYVVK